MRKASGRDRFQPVDNSVQMSGLSTVIVRRCIPFRVARKNAVHVYWNRVDFMARSDKLNG